MHLVGPVFVFNSNVFASTDGVCSSNETLVHFFTTMRKFFRCRLFHLSVCVNAT